MLIELYIFFELLTIVLFFTAFFTKQEIIWAITLVLAGVMMFASYDVQTFVYQANLTTNAYDAVPMSYSYPYLMALNMLFFVLGMVLGLFDLFEKISSGGYAPEKRKNKED